MQNIIYILLFIVFGSELTQEIHQGPNDILNYNGWWIYGEEQHLFKDEITLEEWPIKFLNENNNEVMNLYLEITEMEYFPMESIMKGSIKNDTLVVLDFEITYIQGCGEE